MQWREVTTFIAHDDTAASFNYDSTNLFHCVKFELKHRNMVGGDVRHVPSRGGERRVAGNCPSGDVLSPYEEMPVLRLSKSPLLVLQHTELP